MAWTVMTGCLAARRRPVRAEFREPPASDLGTRERRDRGSGASQHRDRRCASSARGPAVLPAERLERRRARSQAALDLPTRGLPILRRATHGATGREWEAPALPPAHRREARRRSLHRPDGGRLPVFMAERRRSVLAGRWTRDRDRWLDLAKASGAEPESVARLMRQVISEESVASARGLYMSTVERAACEARRARRWEEAATLRRRHWRCTGSRDRRGRCRRRCWRCSATGSLELAGIAEIAK